MARLTLISSLTAFFALFATTFAVQVQFYDQGTKFGVALTSGVAQNDTELQMQITAPSSFGWAAVGTGNRMDGSRMFVIYPASQDSVTLSIRGGKGHDEPRPLQGNPLNAKLTDNTIKDGVMYATIVWQDTAPVLGDVIDPKNHRQPWIWAVGPSEAITSSRNDVSLNEHSSYGVIFANMPESQNPGSSIPAPKVSGSDTVNFKSQPNIYHVLVIGHAIVLGAAFMVVFPFGAVGLRLNLMHSGVKVHMIIQIVAAVACWIALAVAITLSIVGIQYSGFSQPHQMIGIAVTALLTVQIWLGRAHHSRFKLCKKRTWFSFAHMGVGRLVIYGGMLNAVLGLLLSGQKLAAYGAAALSIVIAIIVEFFAVRNQMKRRKETPRNERVESWRSPYIKLDDVPGSQQQLHRDDEVANDWGRNQALPQDSRYEAYRHSPRV